jgi:hypothetical protein
LIYDPFIILGLCSVNSRGVRSCLFVTWFVVPLCQGWFISFLSSWSVDFFIMFYGVVVLHQGREPGKADRLDRLPKIHVSFVCFSSQRKKNPNLFQTELNWWTYLNRRSKLTCSGKNIGELNRLYIFFHTRNLHFHYSITEIQAYI